MERDDLVAFHSMLLLNDLWRAAGVGVLGRGIGATLPCCRGLRALQLRDLRPPAGRRRVSRTRPIIDRAMDSTCSASSDTVACARSRASSHGLGGRGAARAPAIDGVRAPFGPHAMNLRDAPARKSHTNRERNRLQPRNRDHRARLPSPAFRERARRGAPAPALRRRAPRRNEGDCAIGPAHPARGRLLMSTRTT